MPESVRAAADIWQALRSKRGPELVKGLVDELAALHQLYGEIGRSIQQLQIQRNFTEHLLALEDVSNCGPRPPAQLDIYAAQLLEPQEGFHGLEYDDNGVPFRWTGPQRHFSFRVSIDREMPLAVELDVMCMMEEQRQRDLNLLVDGSLFPCRLQREGSGYVGRALLPAAAGQATATLTFIVPATLRPDPATRDQRELGVAFRKLAIRPAGALAAEVPAAMADGARRTRAEDARAATATDAAAPLPAAAKRGPRRGNRREMPGDGLDIAGDVDIPAIPRTFSCTAAEIRDGHPGFYGLEHDDRGAPFRWSGGQSSFSFSVLIDRSAAIELELSVMSMINLRRQSPLRLEIDGAEYALGIERAGDRLEGRMVVPPRAAAGPTSLTFTVPALLRPKGPDPRELGIAFCELHLRPATPAVAPAEAGAKPSRKDRAKRGAGAAAAGPVPRARALPPIAPVSGRAR
jgi:hypothetical protein